MKVDCKIHTGNACVKKYSQRECFEITVLAFNA